MKKIVMGLVAAALLAVSIAAGAQATVYEKFNWSDTWSYPEDCGFDVDVTGSGGGVFVLREGKNQDDGVFPYLDNFRFVERFTNAETGEWFVIRGHVVFNEVKATRVDGDLFLFSFLETGQIVIEDSNGNVVERNRGAIRGQFLFDNGGDDAPGGDYIGEPFDIKIAGKRPGADKVPCDYAAELIG